MCSPSPDSPSLRRRLEITASTTIDTRANLAVTWGSKWGTRAARSASKGSIFNEAVHAKFPLLGLKFKNTSGQNLMQGPITVYEGDTYAGDGRVMDLQPNEERLLSYAVDLGTELKAEGKSHPSEMTMVKIVKGFLHTTYKQRETRTY